MIRSGVGTGTARPLLALFVLAGCRLGFDAMDPPIDGGDPTDAVSSDGDGSVDAAAAPRFFSEVILDLGLGTGLLVCLDAGDPSSYDGTSQMWVNTAPGGVGTSFFLGTNASVATNDPVFSGTPGAASPNEYFVLDSDDWFRETTPAWGDDAFHLSTGQVTIVAMTYSPTDPQVRFFTNIPGGSGIFSNGLAWGRQSSDGAAWWYQEGDNNLGNITTATRAVPLATWGFSAISIGAIGGTSDHLHATNDMIEPYSDEAELYGTMAAFGPATIGAATNGASGYTSAPGTRISMLAVWNRAFSAAELTMLYDGIKARRYTTLP
jgi:hypothetical protein